MPWASDRRHVKRHYTNPRAPLDSALTDHRTRNIIGVGGPLVAVKTGRLEQHSARGLVGEGWLHQ